VVLLFFLYLGHLRSYHTRTLWLIEGVVGLYMNNKKLLK